MTLFPALRATVNQLITESNLIPDQRKTVLRRVSGFIRSRLVDDKHSYLNFICTHNSRRSHIAQLWAQAASSYYCIPGVECYSGGTEATAFNPRAVSAMRKAGFEIVTAKNGPNPVYSVSYATGADPITVFSKKYDDPFNHEKDFAAIMTCSHADENCPFVPGALIRIAITYDDPKEYDDTPQESAMYDERVRQIGREILYAFSMVNDNGG